MKIYAKSFEIMYNELDIYILFTLPDKYFAWKTKNNI